MYKLLTYPDLELGRMCEPVTEFNDELKELIDEMFKIMYANNGIGLAAPQVSVYKQIFVMDVEGYKRYFVNPRVNTYGVTGGSETKEGCLSFPGELVKVIRFGFVEFSYSTFKTTQADGTLWKDDHRVKIMLPPGLASTCIQHEIDHLNGKCIIDYLSKLKRDIILKGIEKKK